MFVHDSVFNCRYLLTMDEHALHSIRTLHEAGLQDKAITEFAGLCRNTLKDHYVLADGLSHLVHYTSIDTLLSMLNVPINPTEPLRLSGDSSRFKTDLDGTGFLRIYDTVYSNDPYEGRFFVDSVDGDHPFRNDYNELWDLFEQRSALPAYAASLVCVSDWRKADDLIFWRTYGQDGTGCAIAFPLYCFQGFENLHRVLYGAEPIESCLNKLHELLQQYSQIAGSAHIESLKSSRDIENMLAPLVYLHKSKAYSYEKEARIIVPFSNDIVVNYQLSSPDQTERKWRHYADLETLEIRRLLQSNSRIILGPTVYSSENIKFVLQQILDRLFPLGPKVSTSDIVYRS